MVEEREAYQVKNFIRVLEEKLEDDRQDYLYQNLPYWKKLHVSIVQYLQTFYIKGTTGNNHHSFDFRIDREDVQYFIDKYKPMIEILEDKERREELRRLEYKRVELDKKKLDLEQRIKEMNDGK